MNTMQQKKTSNHTTIYTVGHSNVEFEKFLGLLNGINVLVDVRSVPFSKYVPQFNIDSIKARLQDVGIEYVFMKDKRVGNIIGGRPKDDTCYNKGDVIYERVEGKEWYKKGISTLFQCFFKYSASNLLWQLSADDSLQRRHVSVSKNDLSSISRTFLFSIRLVYSSTYRFQSPSLL